MGRSLGRCTVDGLTQAWSKSKAASPSRLLIIVSLVAGLALTSCGEQPAPLSEWEVTWFNTVSTVDAASTANATQRDCEDMLSYLRVQRTVVSPVPLEDLEVPVAAWFSEAESIFFDCDLGSATADDSLETLRALENEVEAVLEVEG